MVPKWLRWIRFIPIKLHFVTAFVSGTIAYALGGEGCGLLGLVLGGAVGAPLRLLKLKARDDARQEKEATPARIEPPHAERCPECGGELQAGFVQAQSSGVLWTADRDVNCWRTPPFSRKWEKLQKGWLLGITKKLPAVRYSAGGSETASKAVQRRGTAAR